jgi:hypothetical protein
MRSACIHAVLVVLLVTSAAFGQVISKEDVEQKIKSGQATYEGCGVVTSRKDEPPDHYFMVALQKAEGTSEVRIEDFNAQVQVGAWMNVYHVRVGTMVHPRIIAISEGECKAQSK